MHREVLSENGDEACKLAHSRDALPDRVHHPLAVGEHTQAYGDAADERSRLEQAFLSFYPDLWSYSNALQTTLIESGERQSQITPQDKPPLRKQAPAC